MARSAFAGSFLQWSGKTLRIRSHPIGKRNESSCPKNMIRPGQWNFRQWAKLRNQHFQHFPPRPFKSIRNMVILQPEKWSSRTREITMVPACRNRPLGKFPVPMKRMICPKSTAKQRHDLRWRATNHAAPEEKDRVWQSMPRTCSEILPIVFQCRAPQLMSLTHLSTSDSCDGGNRSLWARAT